MRCSNPGRPCSHEAGKPDGVSRRIIAAVALRQNLNKRTAVIQESVPIDGCGRDDR